MAVGSGTSVAATVAATVGSAVAAGPQAANATNARISAKVGRRKEYAIRNTQYSEVSPWDAMRSLILSLNPRRRNALDDVALRHQVQEQHGHRDHHGAGH